MALWELLAGLALILVALKDIFETLFHPSGRGRGSEFISRYTWRIARRFCGPSHRMLSLIGPVSFVLIVLAWLTLLVVGFALIYSPHMYSGFVLAPGLSKARHHGFADAINVSLGSLITIGGDFNADSKWLRFAMGVEATLGFALLTASLSWILSIYPVLEQRRSMAHRLTLVHFAVRERGTVLARLPEQELSAILWNITQDLTTARNNLAQFPITYYFHDTEPQSSLPGILPFAAGIAKKLDSPNASDSIRLGVTAVEGAIHDYLSLIAVWFMKREDCGSDNKLLAAYAEDHMWEPVYLEQ